MVVTLSGQSFIPFYSIQIFLYFSTYLKTKPIKAKSLREEQNVSSSLGEDVFATAMKAPSVVHTCETNATVSATVTVVVPLNMQS